MSLGSKVAIDVSRISPEVNAHDKIASRSLDWILTEREV